MLRLKSILPPDQVRMEGLAARLKLSRAEAARLQGWAATMPVHHATSDAAFAKVAYRADEAGLEDRLRLALAGARVRAAQEEPALLEAGGYSRLLRLLNSREKPKFPIGGSDLLERGARPGKQLGEALTSLEEMWVDSGFKIGRDALLERAAEIIK